jgi:hypothetical protein
LAGQHWLAIGHCLRAATGYGIFAVKPAARFTAKTLPLRIPLRLGRVTKVGPLQNLLLGVVGFVKLMV